MFERLQVRNRRVTSRMNGRSSDERGSKENKRKPPISFDAPVSTETSDGKPKKRAPA